MANIYKFGGNLIWQITNQVRADQGGSKNRQTQNKKNRQNNGRKTKFGGNLIWRIAKIFKFGGCRKFLNLAGNLIFLISNKFSSRHIFFP